MRWCHAFLAIALTSTACARTPAARLDATEPPARASDVTRYVCPDGSTVEARYPTTETAQITFEGRTIAMRIALSADGARYVGGGWQWWAKGMTEGTLAPLAPGEEIASAPGVLCTARP
jgi:membrane-bound inhibitor of C-type lysozyme